MFVGASNYPSRSAASRLERKVVSRPVCHFVSTPSKTTPKDSHRKQHQGHNTIFSLSNNMQQQQHAHNTTRRRNHTQHRTCLSCSSRSHSSTSRIAALSCRRDVTYVSKSTPNQLRNQMRFATLHIVFPVPTSSVLCLTFSSFLFSAIHFCQKFQISFLTCGSCCPMSRLC